MRILGWLAATSVLWVGFACGGNVVVDGPSDDGSGGTGVVSSSSSSGSAGAGASCPAPTPVGAVGFCGGSSTGVGAGSPVECQAFYCDDAKNTYESKCSGSACVCSFNGRTLCTCAINGDDVCRGLVSDCCGFPFKQ